MFDQARQGADVVLAIRQDLLALVGAEWRALHDPIAHIALVRGVDSVVAEVAQSARQAIETLFAIAALDGAVVGVVPKFDVGIETARRLAPA